MADRYKILIADDEFNTRETLAKYMRRSYDVDTAIDGIEAKNKLGTNRYDLVLTDLRMPGADGFEVLAAANASGRTPCVVLTAYGSIVDAVRAVKTGAFDFVSKPIKLDQLEAVIKSALSGIEPQNGAVKNAAPVREIKASDDTDMIVPQDNDPMKPVYDNACAVAASRASVLLSGESGTGKEVIARLIHEKSGRQGKFVPVHCAALTSTILESELFGYEKGAFTGAAEQRKGKFEIADGGTLFLDEIGEIDLATQVKLLRVLETRSFERVGGVEQVKSDFRLVAATNRNLRDMVTDGTFREDLYYRLAVINLELPPLRKRRQEIPALAKKFIREFSLENNRSVPEISDEAMEKLCSFDWPGNIRQLRNCIESCVVLLQKDIIDKDDIPLTMPHIDSVEINAGEIDAQEAKKSSSKAMRDVEWELIEKTLAECNGNRSKAAEVLGISRRTIQRRLQEHEKK
ncbi:MAG: sigma-54-dependent Fis family transcriptional regulator [Lentisphaeria bacterium]|nr:sigma-54-dependent Fis family transcriptional regulator [Lentisphaeria bacterium]